MSQKVKAHITLPANILVAIDRLAGKRGRSKFITEAVEEKIAKEKFLKALKDSAGAWKDENHPELSSLKDINRYVRKMREETAQRFRKIYHGQISS